MKKDKNLTKELEKWASTEEGAKAINSVMERALQDMLNVWAKTGKLPKVKEKTKVNKNEECPDCKPSAFGEEKGICSTCKGTRKLPKHESRRSIAK